MNGEEVMAALGNCCACGRLFMFDPDLVPSAPIDPVTGLTPDLGGDSARARKEPICADCVAIINPRRRQKGLPEVPVLPGAYLDGRS